MTEGSIMFNPDRPIESLHEDLLNRANLAKSIGEAILKSQTKDSLVIGLLGKWGSGKTSLVNMIEEHIVKISTDVEPEKRPIIGTSILGIFQTKINSFTSFLTTCL